ncbi:hypothetical protein Pfo_010431 [Paulownia fortunei]|nr:hypothetical protein Pfo_010431 [Paulownia fortunei]
MEAFSLLNYWHTGGGTGGGTATLFTRDSTFNARATTKTIVTPASPYSDYGEDGPYFDLEFTLTDDTEEAAAEGLENDETSENTETESGSGAEELSGTEDDGEEEGELKFALTSDESNVTISPTDELFFKGHLVPIEPSSIILGGSEENSKFPVSLLKSATKFRVLLLKLKKPKSANGVLEKAEKSEKSEANGQVSTTPKIDERENQGKVTDKLFTVKYEVEEVKGPLVSLFARDYSSKEIHGKGLKHRIQDSDSNSAPDERNLTKEVMQKYLKLLKPLYVRVSSRYVEKMKFSGQVSFPGDNAVSPPCTAVPSNVKTHQKQGNNNLQAGLKVVRKHLGKSRSTSATVSPPGKTASNRRDDSLLQLQDGIQGAILHCKRSFNASRDGESAILSRSVSDPSYEKSVIMPTVSSAGEAKEIKV